MLMAQEECLSDSLYLCRRQLLEMESQLVSCKMRCGDLEQQLEVAPKPLRSRALRASLQAEALQQRRSVEELTQEHRRLRERRRRREEQRQEGEAKLQAKGLIA